MRPIRANPRLRSRASWTGRDLRLVAIVGAILLLIGGAAGSFVAHVKSASAPSHPQAGLREGAIVFMQGNGNMCRAQTLDNHTGKIGEARMVPCGAEPQTQKVDAFKDGFQRK